MRIKQKQKLNLLDNYIAIYRILYNCKKLLCSTSTDPLNIPNIQKICDQTLDLKSKYEDAFEKLKMTDTSFLLLKQQLIECKGYSSPNIPICNIPELQSSIEIIEKDYLHLNM